LNESQGNQNANSRQQEKAMSAKTIGIIQVKGGAGRSTVSTNLAGELSKLGKTVLIDCDMPQGTSASWFSVREQAGKASNLVADTATNHRELVAKVEQYQDADFIVLDGPPRIAELTRAILVLADLCLIPVGASAAEIWATSDLLALIEEAKKVKPVNARMIWTRYRAIPGLHKSCLSWPPRSWAWSRCPRRWGCGSPTWRHWAAA
jgi:chromosome partitioning protein